MADIIQKAVDVLNQLGVQVTNSEISAKAQNELSKYKDDIQQAINNLLSGTGVITQQQYDELDRQVALAKLKMLEVKSQATRKKYAIIIGSSIFVVAVLFYLSRPKK